MNNNVNYRHPYQTAAASLSAIEHSPLRRPHQNPASNMLDEQIRQQQLEEQRRRAEAEEAAAQEAEAERIRAEQQALLDAAKNNSPSFAT